MSVALNISGSATGVLIGNLIDVLHRKKCEVNCVTVKNDLYDPDLSEYKGALVYHANYVSNIKNKKKRPREFIYAVIQKLTKHKKKVKETPYDNWRVKLLFKKLKHIHAEKYDAIIAVCASHDAMEAVIRFKEHIACKAKAILVQFDPLSENFSLKNRPQKDLIAFEKRLYEKSNGVFSASFILQHKSDEWLSDKVKALELPAITRKNCSEKEDYYINCLYAGDLYRGIRDPYFMLELFSKFKNDKIRLFVLSDSEKDLLQEYAKGKLKNRLYVMGRLPETECNELMGKADVFVNIGNKINNQLPSKILNYMCYGKMILNIYSIPDCPTLSYMNKYSLSLNIDDKEILTEAKVAKIEESIVSHYRERIDFDMVSKTFYECTPEYVTEQILSVLGRENH